MQCIFVVDLFLLESALKKLNIEESQTIISAWIFEIENICVIKIAEFCDFLIDQKDLINEFIACCLPGITLVFGKWPHIKFSFQVMNESYDFLLYVSSKFAYYGQRTEELKNHSYIESDKSRDPFTELPFVLVCSDLQVWLSTKSKLIWLIFQHAFFKWFLNLGSTSYKQIRIDSNCIVELPGHF